MARSVVIFSTLIQLINEASKTKERERERERASEREREREREKNRIRLTSSVLDPASGEKFRTTYRYETGTTTVITMIERMKQSTARLGYGQGQRDR